MLFRYSSYGRHFTKPHLLQTVAQLLIPYLLYGDTVVDFSCGANTFVPAVKEEAFHHGVAVHGVSFDIITSANLDGFCRCSWLDVRRSKAISLCFMYRSCRKDCDCAADMLPPGDSLVIGLNPPFGKNNALARKFTDHAAKEFAPRVIVLIVPPSTPVPLGYRVAYQDTETMAHR